MQVAPAHACVLGGGAEVKQEVPLLGVHGGPSSPECEPPWAAGFLCGLSFPRGSLRACPSGLGPSPLLRCARQLCVCGWDRLLWSPWPQPAAAPFPIWGLHLALGPLSLLKGPWWGYRLGVRGCALGFSFPTCPVPD